MVANEHATAHANNPEVRLNKSGNVSRLHFLRSIMVCLADTFGDRWASLMNKVIRLANDGYTRAGSLLGSSLRQAAEGELDACALRSWTLQTGGCCTLDNTLEHAINPGCPATLDMNWKEVRCWELSNTYLTGDDCNVFLSANNYLRFCPSLRHHPERKVRRPLRFSLQP
jgi:hypothetical protein